MTDYASLRRKAEEFVEGKYTMPEAEKLFKILDYAYRRGSIRVQTISDISQPIARSSLNNKIKAWIEAGLLYRQRHGVYAIPSDEQDELTLELNSVYTKRGYPFDLSERAVKRIEGAIEDCKEDEIVFNAMLYLAYLDKALTLDPSGNSVDYNKLPEIRSTTPKALVLSAILFAMYSDSPSLRQLIIDAYTKLSTNKLDYEFDATTDISWFTRFFKFN